MQAHHPPDRSDYISQSEVKRGQDCPLTWYAEFILKLASATPESRPQRVGSLGHAVVEDAVLAAHEGRDRNPNAALLQCARKRRYVPADIEGLEDVADDVAADCDAAERAAGTFLSSPAFDVQAPVIHNGAPVVEMDLRAPWHLSNGKQNDAFNGMRFEQMHGLQGVKRGMVGTPDIVHERDGAIYCDDYKFRQKPDLGGTLDTPNPTVPDPQGAWYKVLLRGAGIGVNRDVIFRQINVYAGPWITLDEFMLEADRREAGADSHLVTANKLPCRDLKRLGGLVRPEVWDEAWRLLVERRRVASLYRNVGLLTAAGKPRKSTGVRLASEAETWDAKEFVRTLASIQTVQVVEYRLDYSVCMDVVRDMLASVAALYAQVFAGIIPGRNLRTYKTSPCVRPYGCNIQAPCMAALGTGRTVEVLQEYADDGRLRLRQAPHGAVGTLPPGTLAAMKETP